MSILPKALYRFNAIPINIPKAFFTGVEKILLKFIWNHERLWIAKEILKKKSRAGNTTFPDFKLYYKAIIIKTVLYSHKTNRQMEQNQEPRNKPKHTQSTNIWQGNQEYSMERRQFFSINCAKWIFTGKKIKVNPYLTPLTEINSK